MEASSVEQPEEIEDVVIPIKQPEPAVKPKTIYVTGQYIVKPTASMVAEKPANYGQKTVAKKEEKPEVKIDLSGVVEGTTVYHKAFGEGTVTNIDKAQKHIRVKFAVREKTFIFPDAFKNSFLRTENKVV